jgi:hypothetical protein
LCAPDHVCQGHGHARAVGRSSYRCGEEHWRAKMTRSVLRIPRDSTARSLVQIAQWLATSPNRMVQIKGIWPERRYNRIEWREWFRSCLHRKISSHDTRAMRTMRKDDPDWDRAARHCARRVNTVRLIVREAEIPREFVPRLRHRLFYEED